MNSPSSHQSGAAWRESRESVGSSSPDVETTLGHLSALAAWLDDRYRIPGTNIRFGLDSVIGLVPGIGDLATAALSSYIVYEGRRLGAPKRLLLRMAGNILVDVAVGAVPIIGDVADVQWKANRKNLRLLMDHLHKKRSA